MANKKLKKIRKNKSTKKPTDTEEKSDWVMIKMLSRVSKKSIKYNYIYLLQTHHSIDLKENVYKIGKTTQQNINRIRSYPKCSKLLLHMECENCHDSEKILLKKFNKEFKQISKYGNEYFEGDSNDMKMIIINHIMHGTDYDVSERKGVFRSILSWFRITS